MSKRDIAGTVADASLPRTPITVRGKDYDLCFDLGALSEAETAINAENARAKLPDRVNLLVALTDLNLKNTRILFAAALRTFHPEMGFKEALELPAIPDLFRVISAIEAAWTAATADPERPVERPHEPGAEPGETASE
jgi:hypothetical protein